MICGSKFATVLFPVSTTWIVRKLQACHRKTTGLIQMTGMISHRELESDAVFHISPTCFHLKIRRRKELERYSRASLPPSFLLLLLRLQAACIVVVIVARISFPWILNCTKYESFVHSKIEVVHFVLKSTFFTDRIDVWNHSFGFLFVFCDHVTLCSFGPKPLAITAFKLHNNKSSCVPPKQTT